MRIFRRIRQFNQAFFLFSVLLFFFAQKGSLIFEIQQKRLTRYNHLFQKGKIFEMSLIQFFAAIAGSIREKTKMDITRPPPP